MKRVGNLFGEVSSYENLREAFRLAMRGAGNSRAACRFFFHLEPELLELQRELRSGTYTPGRYRYMHICDPKERRIAVAPFRDRVVHHAVVRVLTPVYEPVFIFDSYASRKGKGTHAAVRRAQQFLCRWPWYLKADVARYFDSVDHAILLSLLGRKVKDRPLMSLLEKIIMNTDTSGKGLPMGNLTSQFFANVGLDRLDHEIKDRLRVRGYLRYMDDFVLFGDRREDLQYLRKHISCFAGEHLGLRLKEKGTFVNRSGRGLSFLGMSIYPALVRQLSRNRRRSRRRLYRCVEAWKAGRLEEESMSRAAGAIVTHMNPVS